MDNLYNKVLKKITPTKKEIIAEKKIFNEIYKKIMKIEGSHTHLEWCGSSARNTHLRGDRDLDLFVMFDKELKEEQMEKEGLKIGKIVFKGQKWEKAYSEHPYIRGVYKGFDVEIVPSFSVKSGHEIKSAVDRTPFHNKYLLKTMNEDHRAQARLIKQFMKGIDCYGADLKNCALPGYALELLIVHYGSFENTLREISKWTPGKIVLFENANETHAIVYKNSPLVIIDPVDSSRNVASALSLEQFNRMVNASKMFLEKPSEQFFFPKKIKPLTKKEIEKQLLESQILFLLTQFPKKGLADIVWGQLRRVLKKIETQLREKDFEIIESKLWSDEKQVLFLYKLKTKELPNTKTIIGPPESDIENTKKFLEKKRQIISGPKNENGRVTIVVTREETNAISIVKEFLKEIKPTEKEAIKTLISKAKILDEKTIIKEYKGKLSEYLTKYITKKEIFE